MTPPGYPADAQINLQRGTARVTGVITIPHGGTGAAGWQDAINALTWWDPSVPEGYILRCTGPGGGMSLGAIQAGDLPAVAAGAVVGLTFAAGGTTAVNAALGNVFTLTLTASTTTLGNPSNPVDGQVIVFRIAQGTGGGFTLAYGPAYNFGTAGAPVLSAVAGKTDILTFTYVAALDQWCCLGSGLGFGTGAAPGWNVLQSAVHGCTSASAAVAVTPSSHLSSGTKLVAVVVTQLIALVTEVQDAAGNSFTQQAHVHSDTGGGITLDVWTLDTPSGDAGSMPAITATLSNSVRSAIWLGEVAGLLPGTSGIIDGTAGTVIGTDGTFPLVGPPSCSDGTAGEFLLYVYADNGVGASIGFTAPAGYTLDSKNINYSTTNDLAVCYKSSAGGTETGAWPLNPDTFTSTDSYALILAAFKLS